MSVQFYYPASLTSTDFTQGPTSSGWAPQTFYYGAKIPSCPAGTATKLGVRCISNASGGEKARLALFDSGGNKIAGDNTGASEVTVGTSGAWLDITISQAVSAGNLYVMVSGSVSSVGYYHNDANGNGVGESVSYASAPPSTIDTTEDEPNIKYAVRVEIDTGGGGGTPKRMLTLLGVG